MKGLMVAVALSAAFTGGAKDPLSFPSYEQRVVATFADAATAASAEMSVAGLPDGAARAFATRWDDSTPRHVAKAAMLERAGVKGGFYLCGREDAPVPDWAKDLVAHGHAVGNHTLNHPTMYALSLAEAYRQVLLERIRLETQLGVTVNSYVSPFGWGGRSWVDRETKKALLQSIVETGHWVSCDNPIPELGIPGGVWMAANRFSSGDKDPTREAFESGLKSMCAAADRSPEFPRIVLGTHSWCDEAGNALQEQLLREHCVRPDWVQLNDWDYGAYRYSALYADARKAGTQGAAATYALRRFEPVSLASAIPLSVRFSAEPVAVTCGGRALVRGKNGTWTLPHDADRAAKPSAIVRDGWKGVRLTLTPDEAARKVRLVLANGTDGELRRLSVTVLLPPGCADRRRTLETPSLGPGQSFAHEYALAPRTAADGGRFDFGFGPAPFAAHADFDAAGGRVRIWATAISAGEKPAFVTPHEAARWTMLENASPAAADLAALSSATGPLPATLGGRPVRWEANGDGNAAWYNLTPQPGGRGKLPCGTRVAVLDFRATGGAPVSLFTNAKSLDAKASVFLNGNALEPEVLQQVTARDGVNRLVVGLDDSGRNSKCLFVRPSVADGTPCPCVVPNGLAP